MLALFLSFVWNTHHFISSCECVGIASVNVNISLLQPCITVRVFVCVVSPYKCRYLSVALLLVWLQIIRSSIWLPNSKHAVCLCAGVLLPLWRESNQTEKTPLKGCLCRTLSNHPDAAPTMTVYCVTARWSRWRDKCPPSLTVEHDNRMKERTQSSMPLSGQNEHDGDYKNIPKTE